MDARQAAVQSLLEEKLYILLATSVLVNSLVFTILQNPSKIPVSVEQKTSTSLDLQVSLNRIR